MDPLVSKVLDQMAHGNWKDALPQPIYRSINSWFVRHGEEDVVIRIIFWDRLKNCRHACHLLCEPGTRKTKEVFMPDRKYYDNCDEALLSVPPKLYNLPLFCLPNDTIEKAVRKKRRSNAKSSEFGEES